MIFSVIFQVSLLQPALFLFGRESARARPTRQLVDAMRNPHLRRGFVFDGDSLWLRKLTMENHHFLIFFIGKPSRNGYLT